MTDGFETIGMIMVYGAQHPPLRFEPSDLVRQPGE